MGKKNKSKKKPAWKRYVKDPDKKTWKKKSDYKDSKKRWGNSREQARRPAAFSAFKIREAAYKDSGGGRNSNKRRNNNNNKSRSEKYDRSSGEFSDIKGALGEDIAAGNAAAEDLRDRDVLMGEPDQTVTTPGFPSSLQDLFIEQQEQNNAALEELQEGFNTQIGGLQGQLADAESAYSSANSFMQQQLEASNAARLAAEQRAYNMRNAFVPQANPNALSISYGDQRTNNQRKKENNQLSDLTILSGVGATSNPLAGLQLA